MTEEFGRYGIPKEGTDPLVMLMSRIAKKTDRVVIDTAVVHQLTVCAVRLGKFADLVQSSEFTMEVRSAIAFIEVLATQCIPVSKKQAEEVRSHENN